MYNNIMFIIYMHYREQATKLILIGHDFTFI